MPEHASLPADLIGWLTYLEQLHPKSIALGLDRVGQVRNRLGLQPNFPIITVAGTNGKGSTCAMLERIYREAGYRTACYTSPHLMRYNERVRINGVDATDADLCDAFAKIEAARQDTPLTYFEFGTLAAMWHFVHADVDVAILEVGLGGRLDAVNVFDPACALVTSIDLDHMDYLGNTRESIGLEKAGVYRHGIPAICGDPYPPASLIESARQVGADYMQIGEQFEFSTRSEGWDFISTQGRVNWLPLPALNGRFQLNNAACVVAAVQTMQTQLPVATDAIRAGLKKVTLAGRFQLLGRNPQVILDVAHNPHAAQGLAENLRVHPVAGKTIAVCAMLADKDISGVMECLIPVVDDWNVASIHAPRGAEAELLIGKMKEISPDIRVHGFDDVNSAFRQACLGVGENDRIVVFGSFYTVADVMRLLPETLGDAWQPTS